MLQKFLQKDNTLLVPSYLNDLTALCTNNSHWFPLQQPTTKSAFRTRTQFSIHPHSDCRPDQIYTIYLLHSALTLLVGWQEGHPACKNTEWWGAGVVVCLEQGADLHMAQLMPLPLTDSCFSKIQIGYTFLVPAHLGSPGRGPLNGCVLPATHTARSYACCFQTRTRSLKIYCTIVLYGIPKNQ